MGRQGEGSQAYNIINANYEQSQRGLILKNAEKNAEVRSAIRMRQLELNFNANYDVINGLPRQVPLVPAH